MTTLEQRLDAGDIIIIDGAIGTELQLRGADMDGMAWCAAATETRPDILRTLHEDYIRAGADVITSNTFSSCRRVLEAAGMGDDTVALNRRAVELAV
jgi:methionine synthase I (cobalamin-dependent)